MKLAIFTEVTRSQNPQPIAINPAHVIAVCRVGDNHSSIYIDWASDPVIVEGQHHEIVGVITTALRDE